MGWQPPGVERVIRGDENSTVSRRWNLIRTRGVGIPLSAFAFDRQPDGIEHGPGEFL